MGEKKLSFSNLLYILQQSAKFLVAIGKQKFGAGDYCTHCRGGMMANKFATCRSLKIWLIIVETYPNALEVDFLFFVNKRRN